jgi:hypothetical protein
MGVTQMLYQIKVAKVNSVLDFDSDKLPATSIDYLMTYGLTQAIGDAHASIARKNFESDEKFLAAVTEKVEKRVAQIISGDVPGSRAPADPNAAKARKLVKEVGTLTDAEMALMVEAVNKARAKAARQAETRHGAQA